MQLLYCGTGWLPIVAYIADRLPAGSSIALWDRREALTACVREVDVLLPSTAAITDEVMGAATRLRLIQQPAAGTEVIDRAAAVRRGIPVCNAPGTNHIAVAELALYLLLALARRVPVAARAFAAREIGVPLGIELAGKTLGLLGFGKLGSKVGEIGKAIGMKLIAWSENLTEERCRAAGAGNP